MVCPRAQIIFSACPKVVRLESTASRVQEPPCGGGGWILFILYLCLLGPEPEKLDTLRPVELNPTQRRVGRRGMLELSHQVLSEV